MNWLYPLALIFALLAAPRSWAAERRPAPSVETQKAALRDVIRAHLGEVRQCYERRLRVAKDPLEGEVRVVFHVGANGRVRRAQVSESTVNDAPLEGCITARVRSWQFAARRERGELAVDYPFIFRLAGAVRDAAPAAPLHESAVSELPPAAPPTAEAHANAKAD